MSANRVPSAVSSTLDKLAKGASDAAKGAREGIAVVCEEFMPTTEGGEPARQENTAVRKARESSKVLFNANDLSSDFDQDGIVSADEEYVKGSLKALADEDGGVSLKQLYMLLLQYAGVRKGYRLIKWFALLLVVAFFVQALRVPHGSCIRVGHTYSTQAVALGVQNSR